MDAPRNDVAASPPRFDPAAGSKAWTTASPAEANLDPALLAQADEVIRASFPKMRCFLVAKDGALVFEHYYGGADEATPLDLRSATKSVTAAVAACAGVLGGFEQDADATPAPPTLEALFAELLPRAASEDVRATTTRQLLAMTSGLHWKTGQRLGEAFVPRLHRSKHWVRFALRLPVDPATRGAFVYRSVDSHLLSAAVTATTGRRAQDVAQEALFDPLGIAPPPWEADPQGVTVGHVGLALTGRDLAKLGWLHATGGVWEGRRLLPPGYARHAFTPLGEGLPAFGRYGGHWWIARAATGEAVRCALGHGGQLVFVVPERRLVAVFAADPKVSRWKHPLSLFERYVLAADGVPPP
ncbi:MAG TPA: serine hydrolase [Paenibacillus sp.]|nr:serine hydrolase [Paenibacillus sp.]